MTPISRRTVLRGTPAAGAAVHASAQYSLAAFQCLALIGDRLPG